MSNVNTVETGAAETVVKAPKKKAPKKKAPEVIEAPVVKGASTATAKVSKAGKIEYESHANGAAFSEERPGCVATICEMLQNATAEKPISKQKIVDVILKRHGEGSHGAAGRARTVQMQVPCQMKGEKGLIVVCKINAKSGEREYYVCPTATAEYHASNAKGEFALPTAKQMARQWPGAFGEALAKAKAKLAKKKAS